MTETELSRFLRTWRDRVAPADVGLPSGERRRAPGLRRQELAQLAGVSVEYLTRLEQGRARHPSAQVLGSLARALRLSREERDHLHRLAGYAPTSSGLVDRHLSPGLQRILDRLAELPVQVLDAAWTVVDRNPLAAALLDDVSSLPARERNLAWRTFTGMETRFVRDAEQQRAFEEEIVADLRSGAARYPNDTALQGLVGDLRARSERFDELWRQGRLELRSAGRKTLVHPEAGELTLDCDVLTSQDSDLRLVVYSATPGSPDAETLAFIGVLGTQPFATP